MLKNQTKPYGNPHLAQVRRAGKPERIRQGTPRDRLASPQASRFRLTEREQEVMEHLAKGLLYKEIAHHMSVSYSAIHKLQHKIFLKLQVTNRTEAAMRWRHDEIIGRAE